MIERHRAVNAALADEFRAGLHALSIAKAATPAQWATSQGVHQSPACLGGAALDRKRAEARRREVEADESAPTQ